MLAIASIYLLSANCAARDHFLSSSLMSKQLCQLFHFTEEENEAKKPKESVQVYMANMRQKPDSIPVLLLHTSLLSNVHNRRQLKSKKKKDTSF